MSPTKNKFDVQLASIWLLLILLQLIHSDSNSLDPDKGPPSTLSSLIIPSYHRNDLIQLERQSNFTKLEDEDYSLNNVISSSLQLLSGIASRSLFSMISSRSWLDNVDCYSLDSHPFNTEAAGEFYSSSSTPQVVADDQIADIDVGHPNESDHVYVSSESRSHKSFLEPRHGRFMRQLYGFRCDNAKYINERGITVVDSDEPIQLTLFGERFDLQTIIGFTMDLGKVDQDGSMYDCTDNDRVVSYRLTEANVVTPNMVQITVNLPPNKGDDHYYFCIKQILSPAAGSMEPTSKYGHHKLTDTHNRSIEDSTPTNSTHQQAIIGEKLPYPPYHTIMDRTIWVHQGDDTWLCMIVEQPVMTVTLEVLLIIILLVLSAVTSGLNLGLMSLDMNELAVISSCGSDRERSFARTIQPLRKRGNFLLCSLLLGNVMVNSSLTVILEDLSSGLVAIIGSTLAIVILGEIVPQALCARKGLEIGARTIFLTYSFMLITFPLSYPISRLLDWVLGEENGHVYDRERLMEFIKITGHHTQLESDEVAIISGALKLKKIKVSEIMTRIEDVFMLPLQCQLDLQTIESIIQKGYSRVPVYEANDRRKIVALLLAKDLALLDPDDKTPVETMVQYCRHPLLFVEDHVTLDVALNEFKTGKSHMAIVRQIYDDGELDKYYEAIGVVTLEDVIEEVLQVEINDETDTLCKFNKIRERSNYTPVL